MPILDLNGAKRIQGLAPRRAGRRTLGDPGTFPPGANPAAGGLNGAGFQAGMVNRLTGDFTGRNVSADQELFASSRRLRARARDLSINNPHFIKFLAECEQNIVGEHGIQLQAKVTGINGRPTAQTKAINLRIEEEWKRWCKVGRCTADGGFSMVDVQKLAVRTTACEGENLLKFAFGRELNECAFALQPLDNDQLDETMMVALAGGNQVRMGVEINDYGRPQAYHLWSGHPADVLAGNRERVRVPADQVVHSFIRRRPAQRRGYTWASGAILDLNQLYRYEESVIVAARASAAKFMVIQQAESEGYTGEDDEPGSLQEAAGAPSMSANAGEGMVLEPGQTANFIDPRFPGNNHRDFLRTKIRTIATGLLMDYPTLGNDLESVNFSSIRAGLLDMRDCWRVLQRWFIHHFMEPVFQAWLRMALLTTLRDIALTPAQMEQMGWKGRGWEWVDPLKDTQANVLALENRLTTYTDVLGSKGIDFEEHMLQCAAEDKFIKALGLVVGTDIRGVADTAQDDQAGAQDSGEGGGGGGDSSRAAEPVPFARVLSIRRVEERTPAQIADALEAYRNRGALPPPSPATPEEA